MLLLVSALLSRGALADDETQKLPKAVPGVSTVSAEALAGLLINDDPPLLIDSRISKGRDKGVIEGSISLPDIETNCEALARLLPDKARPVVFYCTSTKCGRSLNAVKIARDCGYLKLLWFRGGIDEWRQAGFPYAPPDRSVVKH